MVGSHLLSLYGSTVVIRKGTEIATFLLEIIRFEANAATCQIGIVLHHPLAQVEHKVGLVKMLLNDHQHIVGSHLGTMQRIVDMQHSALDGLRSLVPSLLAHYLTRLREHEGKGCSEDSGHENHHPEAQSSG